MGVGSREARVPTVEGDRAISSGLFPALDLSLRMQLKLDPHWLLAGVVRYQTSIGLRGRETEVTSAARELVQQRYLLEDDVAKIVKRADDHWNYLFSNGEAGAAPK